MGSPFERFSKTCYLGSSIEAWKVPLYALVNGSALDGSSSTSFNG